MQSHLQAVKVSIQEVEKKLENNHVHEIRELRSVSANIKRFAVSPARPIPRTAAPVSTTAVLSACPRTLYELLDEYVIGIGGSKPAREFTATERGKCKYKYYRRKILWDHIAKLSSLV